MLAQVHLSGPLQYRLRASSILGQTALEVTARRMLKGPRLPQWNWFLEVGSEVLRKHLRATFEMRDVNDARRYLDTIVVRSVALSKTDLKPVVRETFRGHCYIPFNAEGQSTVLYFHGGGYSFYPQAYSNFIALFARAAKSKTFALDYRLSPEHRFPAQLDDALNAYRWLLEGCEPRNLILTGDSAGGNLMLALLLAARDSHLPLPALAIALSPATDFGGEYGTSKHAHYDTIDERMSEQWADWFCDKNQRCDPLVSPRRADLRGLPPIYIQAGTAEILFDSIQGFADEARNQGADILFEPYEDMTHDFQMFGPDVPQAADALRRIGEVIDDHKQKRKNRESVSQVR